MTMSSGCLIMAGGTGGHVFPGLAVANEMAQRGYRIDWLGTPERMEAEIVPANGFPIHFIPVKGLRAKGFGARVKGVIALISSLFIARKVIRQLAPNVVVGMGGYASGPGGIAAWTLGIPVIVHEQNAVPGMTNKLLAKVAKRVMLGFASAIPHFCGAEQKIQVVGNPVRKDILNLNVKRNTSTPLNMLVLGGSLGAKPLNEQLPLVCNKLTGIDIRHQCGKGNQPTVAKMYTHNTVAVSEFIDDMAAAYDWADFIVCRAGALTVSEVAAAGKSAIFVPLPHAVDDHQTLNARFLADKGAGIVLPQSQMNEELETLLLNWINFPEQCVEMGKKAKALAQTNAAKQIADVCEELIERKQ